MSHRSRPADPVVSPADTIRRAFKWIGVGPVSAATHRERIEVEADAQAALDALLAVGERDRQQIARLTAAYCDPKMWRETWLDNGASVWEFLCAADCDEPWNPIAVLAGEEDAANE